MRRLFVLVAASITLSGCGSMSYDMFKMDMFKSTPPPVTIQLESLPPGADAVTSLGPGCKTPCSVSIPPTPSFTVTYSLPRFQPATVPVSVIVTPGDFMSPPSTTVDPNPVSVELLPLAPLKRVSKRPPAKRPPAARPVAAAPAPAPATPFPAPPAR